MVEGGELREWLDSATMPSGLANFSIRGPAAAGSFYLSPYQMGSELALLTDTIRATFNSRESTNPSTLLAIP